MVRCSLPGCTREVYRKPYELLRSRRYFCCASHSTQLQLQEAGLELARRYRCANPACGKPIQVQQWAADKYIRHFCSPACAGAFKRESIVTHCSACGAEMTLNPARFMEYIHNFCDGRCKRKFRRAHSGQALTVSADVERLCEKIEYFLSGGSRKGLGEALFWTASQRLTARLGIMLAAPGRYDKELRDRAADVLHRMGSKLLTMSF